MQHPMLIVAWPAGTGSSLTHSAEHSCGPEASRNSDVARTVDNSGASTALTTTQLPPTSRLS